MDDSEKGEVFRFDGLPFVTFSPRTDVTVTGIKEQKERERQKMAGAEYDEIIVL